MQNEKGLPTDWRERIKGKKVVLYNTGVSGLLNGNEKHIDKINRVFDEFKRHSGVVLWWRPHPLVLSTIESMRPYLKNYYLQTRARFIEENIGILDESADLNRAIAVSDGYYGAWSSVTHLYRATGKPVLLSADEIKTYDVDEKMLLRINDICIVDNNAYCISEHNNLIFVINVNNMEVDNTIELKSEFPIIESLFCNIKSVGTKLVVTPNRGNSISIIDIQSGDIVVKKAGEKYTDNNFEIVSISENKIILFRRWVGAFAEYDVQKNELFYSKNIIGYQTGRLCKNDDDVFTVKSGGNILYKLNPTSQSFMQIYVGNKTDKFFSVTCMENMFIMPHSDRPIITVWDSKKNIRFDISDFPPDFIQNYNLPYQEILVYKDNVFLFPRYSNMILKADIKNRTVKCLEKFNDNKNFFKYSCVKKSGNNVYCFDVVNNTWDILNLNSEVMSHKKVELSDAVKELLNNKPMLNNNVRYSSFEGLFAAEEARVTLKNYLDSIQGVNEVEFDIGTKSNIGNLIHNTIKNINEI